MKIGRFPQGPKLILNERENAKIDQIDQIDLIGESGDGVDVRDTNIVKTYQESPESWRPVVSVEKFFNDIPLPGHSLEAIIGTRPNETSIGLYTASRFRKCLFDGNGTSLSQRARHT